MDRQNVRYMETSALQLVPIELRELAEDSVLLHLGQTDTAVRHLHSQYSHCIIDRMLELISIENIELIKKISNIYNNKILSSTSCFLHN